MVKIIKSVLSRAHQYRVNALLAERRDGAFGTVSECTRGACATIIPCHAYANLITTDGIDTLTDHVLIISTKRDYHCI